MARKLAWLFAVVIVIVDVVLITTALRHSAASRAAQPSANRGVQAIFPAPEMVTPTRSAPATASPPAPAGPDGAGPGDVVPIPFGPVRTMSTTPAPSTSAGIQVLAESRTEETTPIATMSPAPPAPGRAAARPPASDRVLLGVTRDGFVIRAHRGTCPAATPTDIAVSRDGGRTWERIEAAAPQIVRVGAASGGALWFVGTDASCRPIQRNSPDGGVTWRGGSVSGIWYLSPDAEATQVISPQLVADVGCVPLALAGIDPRRAIVACADGLIRGTGDAGDSWTTLSALPGAVSLAFAGPTDGYALAAVADCPARVLHTVDGGRTWRHGVCLTGREPRAIAADGDTVAAQVGSNLFVSIDAGRTWQLAGA